MGLSKASELVIESRDKRCIRTVNVEFGKLEEAISKVDGRTLVIIHYAGHGNIDAAGDLLLCPVLGSDQSLHVERAFGWLQDESIFPTTDTIVILDSCFSGRAIRGILPSERSFEVLAVVQATQMAFGNDFCCIRGQNITFTNRLEQPFHEELHEGSLQLPSLILSASL